MASKGAAMTNGHVADRSAFLSALDADLARDPNAVAVVRVDLDRFSRIREVFGATVSRAVRNEIVTRLDAFVAPQGHVLSYGSDSFVAILRVEDTTSEALEDIGMRIVRELSRPVALDGQPDIAVGCNAGIAASPHFPEPDALRMLAGAELAIQQANAIGSRRVIVYRVASMDDPTRLPQLYADMLGAIARAEFEPFFQPVVAIPSRRLVGAEALVRWRHPVHGLIPPAEFIPEAERSGLVRDIDAQIWRSACETAASLTGPGAEHLSVNVSAVDLDFPDLVDVVAGVLASTGLTPHRLVFEVTETALSQDWGRSRRRLEGLRALGVRIAVDDFGSGHMFLDRLGTGLFDILKIDRSLVIEAGSAHGASLMAGVVSLAHSLDMQVIAEGVETEEQAEQVMATGCEYAQGFLFGRPMTAVEFVAASS
jgi:EAL domain-containing protein (putative c-di-GMP-specific phosphodiesterase class I)/GGDEF domain-containing protein